MFDFKENFVFENGHMATAEPRRFSKFISHLDLFRKSSGLRGEIVELGVFKGNSLFRWIKFRDLLETTYSRKIIAFDMFGDFPETSYEEDKKERQLFIEETDGGVGIKVDDLNQYLDFLGLEKNVEIVKGDILTTLPEYCENNPQLKISLLHIDVDLYEATKTGLDLLFDKVVKGGVVIFDDYGDFSGANKAIDGFLKGEYAIKKLPYSHNISYIVK